MSGNTNDKSIPKFKFSEYSIKTIDTLLESYDKTLKELEKLSKKPEDFIDDSYGVCNKNYKMRYITPSDISTFVSYIGKAVNEQPFPITNVDDLETLSVAMLQRFVNDNKKCIPFEDTNAYGVNANFDQRDITLGKLVIMCANEFYDRGVYSKADMINRAKSIVDDIKILNDMDFDKKVKKLMEAIPKVLNENCPCLAYDSKLKRLIADALTRGIQTICVVNICTIEQMIAYCIPNKSFNIIKNLNKDPNKRLDYDFYDESVEVKEVENSVIVEAVDPGKVKPVFINLSTGGNNLISKTIRNVTKDEYSHSSIGFDIELNKLYTFNGGPYHDNVYNWQKPGFQYEALHSSKYDGIRCTVYCALVPIDVFDKMKSAADDMANSNTKYDYKACLSKIKALVSIDNDNPPRSDDKRKQICSSFVNNLLAIAGNPLGEKEITSPGELSDNAKIKPNQFFCIFDGPGNEYDSKLAQEKIDDFIKHPSSKVYGDKQINEQFTDFYTECCILKTNDLRIRSKIPFNCNMRDIVLQDLHPVFKDTESAIMFMISDERSPITGLLRKYRTIDKVQPNFRVLNMFMHIKPCDYMDAAKDPYYKQNELGMHTDPNWLDKITYGNSFLDGNYRTDAVGNNKFSPIEQSLDHLYSMYCCEGLKTNEELANHVIEVANVMIGIINQYKSKECCIDNWEMLRDILAVFGEILTRTMLKLYDNNSIIFSISDTMDDAAAPGYLYTESFETYMEAAGPSITVEKTNKSGLSKLVGDIRVTIRKFIDWIKNDLIKAPAKFADTYKDQIKYVQDNSNLNEQIKNALDNDFNVNLNRYVRYNINIETFGKINLTGVFKDLFDENGVLLDTAQNNKSTSNDIAILNKIYENIGANKQNNAPAITPNNLKELCNQIITCLMGAQQPVQKEKLTGETWEKDVIGTIINTKALIEEGVNEYLTKPIDEFCNKLDEKIKNTPKPTETSEQPGDVNKQQQTDNTTNTFNSVRSLTDNLVNPLLNSIENMFKENYKLYFDTTRSFNAQYDSNKQPAQQNAGNAPANA